LFFSRSGGYASRPSRRLQTHSLDNPACPLYARVDFDGTNAHLSICLYVRRYAKIMSGASQMLSVCTYVRAASQMELLSIWEAALINSTYASIRPSR